MKSLKYSTCMLAFSWYNLCIAVRVEVPFVCVCLRTGYVEHDSFQRDYFGISLASFIVYYWRLYCTAHNVTNICIIEHCLQLCVLYRYIYA